MYGFIIPALNAEKTIGKVVSDLSCELARMGIEAPIIVIDDGSTDHTAEQAELAGAVLIRHDQNRGKGSALLSGMRFALDRGLRGVVSLDADGQHPVEEAVKVLLHPAEEPCLVLAVRNLVAAGAPIKNQRSNHFSNLVLSWFAGQKLLDTQCGLRRYPLPEALDLRSPATGFAFESDFVLRAARRGLPIEHLAARVIYPPEAERLTHFHSVRDPTKIVLQVVRTTLLTPHFRFGRRWLKRGIFAALFLFVILWVLHLGVAVLTTMTPPSVDPPKAPLRTAAGERRVGQSSAVRRDGIWEVHLRGTPAELGWAHATLLRDRMIDNETVLYGSFQRQVPWSSARTLIFDVARFRYRHVDQGLSPARREELAAEAQAFEPDPFSTLFPTYQRFVFLNALYDISLSFEHSPLIGCTTFTVAPSEAQGRTPLLARVFDFEVDDIFDRDKAVFFVEEDGKIPFASVAWPGLVGVVSGMNRFGLTAVVHGARAGPTSPSGEPVVHTVRRLLSEAEDTPAALRLLEGAKPMVSHLLILQDAKGRAVAVERAVGHPPFVRELPPRAAVSNHFEGPLAQDPKNQRVLATTSTLARRARGEALLAQGPAQIGPLDLLAWLRDRQAEDGSSLPPGDRRAIDAHIATHAIIARPNEGRLWVSRGPHLDGRFVEYDLTRELSPDSHGSARAGFLPAATR